MIGFKGCSASQPTNWYFRTLFFGQTGGRKISDLWGREIPGFWANNPPAASVSTRLHNTFVAGYHNATDSVLGLILCVEEYGPAILIWFLIFILPAILLWRRYQRTAAAV